LRAGAAVVLVLAALGASAASMNIDDYWEYSDPAASEVRFRAALAGADPDTRLELQTQIARTFSLRRQFADAHSLLDEIEPRLASAGAAPQVRYLLERGRTYNSGGDPARSRGLFERAWERARTAGLIGLAVDAAHMLAIVTPPDEAARWTRDGLELARASNDAKARALLPALLNNHAWNLHDTGRYEDALAVFREAETEWHLTGRQPQGRIATWSVARCLRSLQRHEEALSLQHELEREWQKAGGADGYVFEEIAENLHALGQGPDAARYYRRAADELAKDPSFARDQPERWQRLLERSGG
jgi:tetratricopeptide (TPR) repeat protein